MQVVQGPYSKVGDSGVQSQVYTGTSYENNCKLGT